MEQLIAYLTQNLIVQREPEDGYTDVAFMSVKAKPEATAEEYKQLLDDVLPPLGLNLFDHNEHSYIEIGGVVGDQGLALRLMGMGTELKLWELLTPKTMLKIDNNSEVAQKMAGMGMLSIIFPKPQSIH